MTEILAVMLGGGLGGALRYSLGLWVTRRLGDLFPWATLFVNVTGSLLIGAFAVLAGVWGVFGESAAALLMVGLCGSYTTVSSFSLQTLALAEQGEWSLALANVLISVFSCLTAVWVGATLMRLMVGS